MSSVSGTPSMTESPRQMTPSQSKMKQSTLSTSARLSAVSALRAAGGRRRRACGVSGGRAIVSGLNWRRCAFTSCARRRCQRAQDAKQSKPHCAAQTHAALRPRWPRRAARSCAAPGAWRVWRGMQCSRSAARACRPTWSVLRGKVRAASARLLLFGRAGAVCCVLRASRKGV